MVKIEKGIWQAKHQKSMIVDVTRNSKKYVYFTALGKRFQYNLQRFLQDFVKEGK